MKRLPFVLVIFVTVLIASCNKNDINSGTATNPFLDSVTGALHKQLSEEDFNRIDFSNYSTVNGEHGVLGFMIHMKDKNDKRYISATKSDEGLLLNRVELTTDMTGMNGQIRREDLYGSGISTVDFKNGLPIKLVKSYNGKDDVTYITYTKSGQQISSSDEKIGVQPSETPVNTLPPVTVTGYINHNYFLMYSYYYSTNSASNMWDYTPSGGGSGGSSPSALSLYKQYNFGGDTRYKINLADYIKCFTNLAGSNYKFTITICVDQPKPGQRDAWSFSNADGSSGSPSNVGHTFMILTETTPTGTTSRNVGFYPSGKAFPGSSSSPGELINNQQHGYNISLAITVNNSQFFSVLNYLSATQNATYDLNSNNCTSYTLGALNSIGISLPATRGTWPGGSGFDPGDLGEDIRNMTLPSNMTKTTAPTTSNNNETSHPNTGQCAL